jgi:hypothetical protein
MTAVLQTAHASKDLPVTGPNSALRLPTIGVLEYETQASKVGFVSGSLKENLSVS